MKNLGTALVIAFCLFAPQLAIPRQATSTDTTATTTSKTKRSRTRKTNNTSSTSDTSAKQTAPNQSANAAPSTGAVQTASKAANTPNKTAAPGGGPGMVWVNPETKVYHVQGDRWYGKTKTGKYMTQADAEKAGYRASKGK